MIKLTKPTTLPSLANVQVVPFAHPAISSRSEVLRFDVVDTQTGVVVGKAKTRARGYQSAEKRNQQYGAHRYACKAIYA